VRSRGLLVGVRWCRSGSLLCGVARGAWLLGVARVVRAFGGAQLSPASLALG